MEVPQRPREAAGAETQDSFVVGGVEEVGGVAGLLAIDEAIEGVAGEVDGLARGVGDVFENFLPVSRP